MGSSGEPNVKGIDPSVGGLVWVRRRNGSWWPGKIMGLDELSETRLVSPRCGTPVKLLGREDASVDWYNLEKSKRVKSFRCGEYDECIEKAKASAENASKKAVKYARREDAILHALELESACQSNAHPNPCSRTDKSDGEEHAFKEPPTMSDHSKETIHMEEELSSFEENSNSAQELSHSSVSFENPNQIGDTMEQSTKGSRRKTPNDSEDDGTEGIKRMRGLDDLGMREVSSSKRKRPQVGNVHEFLKKRSRRRALTKVLESANMVSVPIMCDGELSVLESNESKRSFPVINNNSDSTGVTCENGSLNALEHGFDASVVKNKENEISSMLGLPENDSCERLFDVPFFGDENHYGGFSPIFASCSFQKTQVGAGGQPSQSSQVEMVSPGNEELNESGSTSSGADDVNNISEEKETSKWQSKGKRNSRIVFKNRKQDLLKLVDADNEPNEFRGWSRHNYQKDPHMRGPTGDLKLLPDCSPTPKRSLRYCQSNFTVNPKYQIADFAYRDYDIGSPLYDVYLEVNASYGGQHVPYKSFMSKLNSQPIIGHPVMIEVLDDGFCDLFLNDPDCSLANGSHDMDDDLEENMSASNGIYADYDVKPNPRGRRIPAKHLILQPHVSPSKSPKMRKSGPSPRKIRTLSSLTSSHMQRDEEKKSIMVEKLKGPAIACVPLNIVFSRINASMNCSTRPPNRVVTFNAP